MQIGRGCASDITRPLKIDIPPAGGICVRVRLIREFASWRNFKRAHVDRFDERNRISDLRKSFSRFCSNYAACFIATARACSTVIGDNNQNDSNIRFDGMLKSDNEIN